MQRNHEYFVVSWKLDNQKKKKSAAKNSKASTFKVRTEHWSKT